MGSAFFDYFEIKTDKLFANLPLDQKILYDKNTSNLSGDEIDSLRDIVLNTDKYIMSKKEYDKMLATIYKEVVTDRGYTGSLNICLESFNRYVDSVKKIKKKIETLINSGELNMKIKVNDHVLVVGSLFEKHLIQVVTAVLENENIVLQDGEQYNREEVLLLIPDLYEIKVGDQVSIKNKSATIYCLINAWKRTSRKAELLSVIGITEQFQFLLSDNKLYNRIDISKIVGIIPQKSKIQFNIPRYIHHPNPYSKK